MKQWSSVILLATLFAASLSFGQSWTAVPSGTTQALRHVQFVNAQVGYAVGAGGMFLKTTNGGESWSNSDIWNGNLIIGCYFVNPDTGWVGGDRGVMKTTNGGASWTYQIGPDGITKLFFVDASLGWAVGGCDGCNPKYGEIYKTTNGGATWTKQSNSSVWSRFYGVHFVSATTGWAYSESNGLLIKTTNGGSTWDVQLSYGTSVMLRGIYFYDATTGWVGGRTNTSGVALRTTDGGATFTDYGTGLQYALGSMSFIDASRGWATAAGQSGVGVLNTTNGGVNWSFTAAGTASMNSIFFLDSEHGWIVGNNGTILKYTQVTGVDEAPGAPEAFGLEQNWPNPFNPLSNLRFTISSALGGLQFVSLKVYNVLGEEVATLVNEVKEPGSYEVEWHASGVPSGIYFYRLEAVSPANPAERFSETRRMVLMK